MNIVPKNFHDLRRISLSTSMIADHTTVKYYEALLEVRSVRNAKRLPNEWTSFKSSSKCACCQSDFTWASTSKSEAQEARDKHNCRACGGLVCEPCSKRRVPLPEYGIHLCVRVCDGCYYELGTRGGDLNGEDHALTRSYTEENSSSFSSSSSLKEAPRPENSFEMEGDKNRVASARSRTDSGRRRGSSVVEELITKLNNDFK